MKKIATIVALIICTSQANAQGYVDQDKVRPILDSQDGPVEQVQKAEWQAYDYKEYIKNDNRGAWTEMQATLNALPGDQQGGRLEIVELANRVTSDKLKVGRKLVIPTTFPADFRAYAPYPFEYSVADTIPRLFIVDKYTQTFGAYEYGKLVRWGLVSTGDEDSKTPTGTYSFTWKAEYRESSAAPEGETWELKWMFNFDPKAGLHVHQYSLPIAAAASHGCVRLSMADAQWNYAWAEGWGADQKNKGTPVWIINHNPVSRPAHWDIGPDGQVISLVRLPEDPRMIRTYARY